MEIPRKMSIPGAPQPPGEMALEMDGEAIIINSGANREMLTVSEALQVISDLSMRVNLHEQCKTGQPKY